MSYALDIRLRNETAEFVDVIIPKATVFEGVRTSGILMQNLAVVKEYRLTLGPNIDTTLHMQGDCINPSLSPPRGWVMRPTVFTVP